MTHIFPEVDKVEQYFDEDIYNELVKKYKPKDIHNLLKSKLRNLVRQL